MVEDDLVGATDRECVSAEAMEGLDEEAYVAA